MQKQVVVPRLNLSKNFLGGWKPHPQPLKMVKYGIIQNLSCRISLEMKLIPNIFHIELGSQSQYFLK